LVCLAEAAKRKAACALRQMNVKQGENVEMRQVLCVIE
jgi:hypothetical protein